MDRVRLVIDRTAAGLQDKVNRAYEEGYRPDGSFNRTDDGRWFMQTMTLPEPSAPERVEPKGREPKPNRAKKAPSKKAAAKK